MEEHRKLKIVIMGCGWVGATLAAELDKEGHQVTILDINPSSFRRLPPTFSGNALLGDGTDEETLKNAGIEEADAFVAVTQGDNRNIMAAHIAKEVFGKKKVICRIYDPFREDLYDILGLEAVSPTKVITQLLKDTLTKQ